MNTSVAGRAAEIADDRSGARASALRLRKEMLADWAGELAVLRHVEQQAAAAGRTAAERLRELAEVARAGAGRRTVEIVPQRHALRTVVAFLDGILYADRPAMALARARALRIPVGVLGAGGREEFAELAADHALASEILEVWQRESAAARAESGGRSGDGTAQAVSQSELADLIRAAREVAHAEVRLRHSQSPDPAAENARLAARAEFLAHYVLTPEDEAEVEQDARREAQRQRLDSVAAEGEFDDAWRRAADEAEAEAYELVVQPARGAARQAADALGEVQWWRALARSYAANASGTNFREAFDQALASLESHDGTDVEFVATLARVTVHADALRLVLDRWRPWLRGGKVPTSAAELVPEVAAQRVHAVLAAADVPMSEDELHDLRAVAMVEAFVTELTAATQPYASAADAAAAHVERLAAQPPANRTNALETLVASLRSTGAADDHAAIVAMYRVSAELRRDLERARAQADEARSQTVDRVAGQIVAGNTELVALAQRRSRRAARLALTADDELSVMRAGRLAEEKLYAAAAATVDDVAAARARLAQLGRLSSLFRPELVDVLARAATEEQRRAALGVTALEDAAKATVADRPVVMAAWLVAEGRIRLTPGRHILSSNEADDIALAYADTYAATRQETTRRADVVAAAQLEAQEARDREIARRHGRLATVDEPVARMREAAREPMRGSGFTAARVAYLQALSAVIDVARARSESADPVTVNADAAALADRLAGLMVEAENRRWTATRLAAAESAAEAAERAASDAADAAMLAQTGTDQARDAEATARQVYQDKRRQLEHSRNAQRAAAQRAQAAAARRTRLAVSRPPADGQAGPQRPTTAVSGAGSAQAQAATAHAVATRSVWTAQSAVAAAAAAEDAATTVWLARQTEAARHAQAATQLRAVAAAARQSLLRATERAVPAANLDGRSSTAGRAPLSVADAAAMEVLVDEVRSALVAVRNGRIDVPEPRTASRSQLTAVARFIGRVEAAEGARSAIGTEVPAAAYLRARDANLEARVRAATDVAPWFAYEGALGDGTITGADLELSAEVHAWIDDVVARALAKATPAARRATWSDKGRQALRAVLLSRDAATWQRQILTGKTINIAGVPVRLTFELNSPQFLVPDDAAAEKGLSEYLSRYGDQTVRSARLYPHRRQFKVKLDPAIFAVGPFSALIPHLTVSESKLRERASGFGKEVQSGNRALVNPTFDFRSTLSVKASVMGEGPLTVRPDGWLRHGFPRAFSSLAGKAAPHPLVEVRDATALHNTDFSVNAVAVSGLADEFYRSLTARGVPSDAALQLQQEAVDHFFNEKAVKDRSQWWLTNSWVSGTFARASASGRSSAFEGYLRVAGSLRAVALIEVTQDPVIIRNDIADTTTVVDDRGSGTGVGAGIGSTFARVFGAAHHLAVPEVALEAGVEVGTATKVSGVGQAKTATMRREQMARYRAVIDFSVTVHSATHGEFTFGTAAIGEIGMARSHAAWWETAALGGASTGSGLISVSNEGGVPSTPPATDRNLAAVAGPRSDRLSSPARYRPTSAAEATPLAETAGEGDQTGAEGRWTVLDSAADRAGQRQLAAHLRGGHAAQIQLDGALTAWVRMDATLASSNPLRDLIGARTRDLVQLLREPRFSDVVAMIGANGEPIGDPATAPPSGARFVLGAHGGERGPLRVQHHVVDPEEPIELAARVALGDGVVREMPGAQQILPYLRSQLWAQMQAAGVLPTLTGKQRRHIDRVLATRFGVPGLRGQARTAVDGAVTQSFTFSDLTFTVALSSELRELRGKARETGLGLDVQHKGAASTGVGTGKATHVGAAVNTKLRVKLPGNLVSFDFHPPEAAAGWFRKRKVVVTDVTKEYRRRRPSPEVTRFDYGAVHRLSVVTTRTVSRLRLRDPQHRDPQHRDRRPAAGKSKHGSVDTTDIGRLRRTVATVYRGRVPRSVTHTEVVSATVRELSGDEHSVAVVVSQDHLPKVPPSWDDVIALGSARVRAGRLDGADLAGFAQTTPDKRLRLHENGMSGVFVTALGIKRLAEEIDTLIGDHDGVRRDHVSRGHQWRILADITGSGAPHPSSTLLTQQTSTTYLESKVRQMVSPQGLAIALDDTPDGWHQQVTIRLSAFDARSELGDDTWLSATGLEQYNETDVKVSEERVRGWHAGTSFGIGLGIKLVKIRKTVQQLWGSGTDATDTAAPGGAAEQSLQTGNKFLTGGAVSVVASRATVTDSMLGGMALNVGTYRGASGRYRANAVYQIEYRRWRKKRRGREASHSAHVNLAVQGGLALSMGQVRAVDHGLAAAAPARDNDAEREPDERVISHPDLAAGIGYAERLDASAVLPAIEQLLNRPTLAARRDTLDPRLANALAASFGEEALRVQLNQAREGSILRVFKTPAQLWQHRDRLDEHGKALLQFHGTVYTAVRVTVQEHSAPTYVRARPDLLLSMGGQALSQDKATTQRKTVTSRAASGLVRFEVPKVVRLSAGADYERRREVETIEGEERTQRVIRRATAHDSGQEFRHELTFRIEVHQTTQPHLAFLKAGRALRSLTRTVVALGDREAHRWWQRHVQSATLNPHVVDATAHIVVPTALTRPRNPSPGGTPASPPEVRVSLADVGDKHLPPMTGLAKSLAKYGQSWAMPGLDSVARWAPAAAVRDPIDVRRMAEVLRSGTNDPQPPPFTGFEAATTDGHVIAALMSHTVQRNNAVRLLRGELTIPLQHAAAKRMRHITVQVVPIRARWVDRVGLTQLNFPEETVEPIHERTVADTRDWDVGGKVAQPVGPGRGVDGTPTSFGPTFGPQHSRGPTTVETDSAGSYEERNLERKGSFDIYEVDVVYLMLGPARQSVRVFVRGGLKMVLPTVTTPKIAAKNPEFEAPPTDVSDILEHLRADDDESLTSSLSATLLSRVGTSPSTSQNQGPIRLWFATDGLVEEDPEEEMTRQRWLVQGARSKVSAARELVAREGTPNARFIALVQEASAQENLAAAEAMRATHLHRQRRAEAVRSAAAAVARAVGRPLQVHWNNPAAGTVRQESFAPDVAASGQQVDPRDGLDPDPFAVLDSLFVSQREGTAGTHIPVRTVVAGKIAPQIGPRYRTLISLRAPRDGDTAGTVHIEPSPSSQLPAGSPARRRSAGPAPSPADIHQRTIRVWLRQPDWPASRSFLHQSLTAVQSGRHYLLGLIREHPDDARYAAHAALVDLAGHGLAQTGFQYLIAAQPRHRHGILVDALRSAPVTAMAEVASALVHISRVATQAGQDEADIAVLTALASILAGQDTNPRDVVDDRHRQLLSPAQRTSWILALNAISRRLDQPTPTGGRLRTLMLTTLTCPQSAPPAL